MTTKLKISLKERRREYRTARKKKLLRHLKLEAAELNISMDRLAILPVRTENITNEEMFVYTEKKYQQTNIVCHVVSFAH